MLPLLGFLLATNSPAQDFRVVYFPARCLLQHCDPYSESDMLRLYRAEGGESPSVVAGDRVGVTRYIYPPTAFSFTLPFAMLPWRSARVLRTLFSVGTLVVAALLAWELGAAYTSALSGGLCGFLLANCMCSPVSAIHLEL